MNFLRTISLLLLSVGLLVLTACGAASTPAASTPTPATSTNNPTATAPAAERPTTAPSEAESEADTAGETRTVTHAMGTTEVPANPQRVVVLDTGELDSALALGVKPVGAVSAFPDGELPSYLEGMTEGIEVVGTITEPNLEAILALNPDLILSSKVRHEEIYDELSAIAPTVFAETVGVVWKENFLLNAEALGKQADARALLEAYEARLEELRAALGDQPPAVSVVRFLPGQVRIYLKDTFIGTILEDAGIPRPEAQDVNDFAIYVEDQEGIPQMDGDVIFFTTYGPADGTQMADYVNSPLWQQLSAVRNGRVHEVPDSYWMLGIGMLAANRVIDDLFFYLVDEAGSVAVPESRIYVNADGSEVEIPSNLQRVVALSERTMDSALALGASVVGLVNGRGAQQPPAYLQPYMGEAVSVGSFAEPSLEAILKLEPDLIIIDAVPSTVEEQLQVEWIDG